MYWYACTLSISHFRFGRKIMLSVGSGIFTLTSNILPWLPSINTLLFIRFVMGMMQPTSIHAGYTLGESANALFSHSCSFYGLEPFPAVHFFRCSNVKLFEEIHFSIICLFLVSWIFIYLLLFLIIIFHSWRRMEDEGVSIDDCCLAVFHPFTLQFANGFLKAPYDSGGFLVCILLLFVHVKLKPNLLDLWPTCVSFWSIFSMEIED